MLWASAKRLLCFSQLAITNVRRRERRARPTERRVGKGKERKEGWRGEDEERLMQSVYWETKKKGIKKMEV